MVWLIVGVIMSLTRFLSRFREACCHSRAYTTYVTKLGGFTSSDTTSSGSNESDVQVSPQTVTKLPESRKGVYKPSERRISKANDFFKNAGKKAFLQTSAYKPEQSPTLVLPEIAFLGRTSVGKSSLINAVLNTKKLVRTSKKPGQTRLVNFFNIDNKMYLVDLPGYGYAPGLGKHGHYFVKVAESYLQDRKKHKLRNICLLIDGEIGVKNNDLVAFEMLEEFGIPYQVVMTKIDRASSHSNELVLQKAYEAIDKHTNICFAHIFPVSAKKKTGLGELRCFIAESAGLFK